MSDCVFVFFCFLTRTEDEISEQLLFRFSSSSRFFMTLGSPSFPLSQLSSAGMQIPLFYFLKAHTQIYIYKENKHFSPSLFSSLPLSQPSGSDFGVLLRRPRLDHLVDKHLEAHVRVVRPGARLRVVLDAQRRLVLHHEPGARAVVEVDVRDLDAGRQARRVDGEVVVLGRDLDAARGLVADRVVAPVVAELELEGGAVW